MSHERNTYPETGLPAHPREDDITETEWSGDHVLPGDGRNSIDTQGNGPLPRPSINVEFAVHISVLCDRGFISELTEE